jgi:predicted acyl esterase
MPFRDSVSPMTGDRYWMTSSAYTHIDEIGANDVPMYMYGSWYDPFGNETINAWLNYTNPKWLMMSRGAHCQTPDIDRDAQFVRFFDYWLKGIDNGYDQEPKVRYYVEGGQPGHEWQTAQQWPLPANRQRFMLGVDDGRGVMGNVQQGTEEALTVTPPDNILPFTNFSVVRSGVDPLSVVYTSAPLTSAQLVAGTPVVHLTVSAPAGDYVVKAFLEHVNGFRSEEVIAHGKLLASHRQLGEAPFDTGGIPWPTHLQADSLPVNSGEPVELTFGLSPIARQLRPGDRLRLAVTLRTAADEPLLPLTVYTGGGFTSWVEVPFAE